MKGVILQPGYLPWLGFFNQMAEADIFIFLDDVQYDRRGWRNRNRIKGPAEPIWMTVPVIQKGLYNQLLLDARIDNSNDWGRKHLMRIKSAYSKTPFFEKYFPTLSDILKRKWELLIDLDVELIKTIAGWFDISTHCCFASDFKIVTQDKTGRLVDLCKLNNIREYISGSLCKNYMDFQQMQDAGIRVLLQEYTHPEYAQTHPPFEPFLSAIDLLFNLGAEQAKKIYRDVNAFCEHSDAVN